MGPLSRLEMLEVSPVALGIATTQRLGADATCDNAEDHREWNAVEFVPSMAVPSFDFV